MSLLQVPPGSTPTERADILQANRDIARYNRDERQAYDADQRKVAADKRAASQAAATARLAAQRAGRPRHEAVGVRSAGLTATTILPESPEVRFVDAAINIGVAGATALWTATRPTTGSQVGWGFFWTFLGGLMFVEGRGELRYAGGATSAANATLLTLLLFKPNLKAAA
ncbi:MAG: hypothetical protein ACYCT1_08370 [Steroidobacteraceae bacterium]